MQINFDPAEVGNGDVAFAFPPGCQMGQLHMAACVFFLSGSPTFYNRSRNPGFDARPEESCRAFA